MRIRTSPTITRRSVFTAALASLFTAWPVFAARAKPVDPDAALHALVAEYDRRKAEVVAMAANNDDDTFDAAADRLMDIECRIYETTPRTPAGLAQKIRVAEENEAGGERDVMRRLAADAFAVAGAS